jgi:ParB family chromosome partitioning protein
MASNRKRNARLGRGLSSLMAQPVSTDPQAGDEEAQKADLPTSEPSPEAQESEPVEAEDNAQPSERDHTFEYVALTAIRPNPHQPRDRIDEEGLHPLAESIKNDGLMQPIVLRPVEPTKTEPSNAEEETPPYEIVAGERRWRAARIAGLERVPALIRHLDEQQTAELALIENLQREDLNPIERAEAFQHLADTFGLSHYEIGQRVGLNRSSVANMLRLLNLSDQVRDYLRRDLLSMGQARSIAGLSDPEQQRQIADQTIRQGLSVRQVEQFARRVSQGEPVQSPNPSGAMKTKVNQSAYLADLENQIAEQLQTKVQLKAGRKKGTGSITIEFYSLDQFDGLLTKLGVETE